MVNMLHFAYIILGTTQICPYCNGINTYESSIDSSTFSDSIWIRNILKPIFKQKISSLAKFWLSVRASVIATGTNQPISQFGRVIAICKSRCITPPPDAAFIIINAPSLLIQTRFLHSEQLYYRRWIQYQKKMQLRFIESSGITYAPIKPQEECIKKYIFQILLYGVILIMKEKWNKNCRSHS